MVKIEEILVLLAIGFPSKIVNMKKSCFKNAYLTSLSIILFESIYPEDTRNYLIQVTAPIRKSRSAPKGGTIHITEKDQRQSRALSLSS